MSETLLNIFHKLPGWMRSGAASLHGLQLRSWRFGPETPRLVSEVLEREEWDAAQWRKWQQEQLAQVLHRAATRVPYYRDHWAARRRRGDSSSWELLENWPLLEKEEVRNQPRAFVADDCDPRRMFYAHTSGTTGTPVIASNIAGIHEALHDGCGQLVPARDVSALASAIENLLSNPQLRRSFADAARRRAEEKFDMWRNGENLAQILRSTRRSEQRNAENCTEPSAVAPDAIVN